MSKKQKIMVAALVLVIAGVIVYFTTVRDILRKSRVEQVVTEEEGAVTDAEAEPLNQGNISPITGIACENWNRRPIAVMQPSDVQVRPAAGFSEADMVFE